MFSADQLDTVRELYRQALPPGGSGTLDERRAGFESLLVQLPLDDRVVVSPHVSEGVITGYWVDGSGRSSPRRSALLLHGGGYIMGSAKGYLSVASRIAATTESRVFVPEYPLAPESPFPHALTAMQDSWNMVEQAAEQSFLIGDSAGGGLAVALACALRDAGQPLPDAIALFSPLTDLRATSDTYDLNSDVDPICSRRGIQRAAELYLEGVDPQDVPLASPLLAELHDLPPIHVHVGTDEVLLGDSTSLVAAVARAGGAVTLRVRQRMVHVWPLFWSKLDEGALAIDEVSQFFDEVTTAPRNAV